MQKLKKSISILDLTGSSHQKISDYFKSREIYVMASGSTDFPTHIIINQKSDLREITKKYFVEENKIKLISLDVPVDSSDFLGKNGNLAIDDSWFGNDVGYFILDKYFQEHSGIIIGNEFPSFEQKGSFIISNPFSTGDYIDRLIFHAFSSDHAALAIRTYFDHIIMFLAGLRDSGKAGLPFEVNYGTSSDVFGIQIMFSAKNLNITDIQNKVKANPSKKNDEYILNLAMGASGFFDFTLLQSIEKVVVTALWNKGAVIDYENKGFLFSVLDSEHAVANLPVEGVKSFITDEPTLVDFSNKSTVEEWHLDLDEEEEEVSENDIFSQALSNFLADDSNKTLSSLVKLENSKIVPLGHGLDETQTIHALNGLDENSSSKLVKGLSEVKSRKLAKTIDTAAAIELIQDLTDEESLNLLQTLPEEERLRLVKGLNETETTQPVNGFKEQAIGLELIKGTKEVADNSVMQLVSLSEAEVAKKFNSMSLEETGKLCKGLTERGMAELVKKLAALQANKTVNAYSDEEKARMIKGLSEEESLQIVKGLVAKEADLLKVISLDSKPNAVLNLQLQSVSPSDGTIVSNSEDERFLSIKNKTLMNDIDKLNAHIKSMSTEIKILKENRTALAEQLEGKVASEELARLNLTSEDRDNYLMNNLKTVELKIKKMLIETAQIDSKLATKLEQAQKESKTKDQLLLKAKEVFTKMTDVKESELNALKNKLDDLTKVHSPSVILGHQKQITDLEKQNTNLNKMIEMYKGQISSMSSALQKTVLKTDEEITKEESKRLERINTQLKNQLEYAKKDISKYQEKLTTEARNFQELKKEKIMVEQLLKKATLSSSQLETSQENVISNASIQTDHELKKLQSNLQYADIQNKEHMNKIKDLEAKLVETQKMVKVQMAADKPSSKIPQLEGAIKKLTKDLLESKNQLAAMKKETNKMRQEKNGMQNMIEKLKKDVEKERDAAPKKTNGGKAA